MDTNKGIILKLVNDHFGYDSEASDVWWNKPNKRYNHSTPLSYFISDEYDFWVMIKRVAAELYMS